MITIEIPSIVFPVLGCLFGYALLGYYFRSRTASECVSVLVITFVVYGSFEILVWEGTKGDILLFALVVSVAIAGVFVGRVFVPKLVAFIDPPDD